MRKWFYLVSLVSTVALLALQGNFGLEASASALGRYPERVYSYNFV